MTERANIKMTDVCAVVREAGALVLKTLTPDVSIENKSDDTPVTEADKKANRLIKARLKALYPDIPITSEEDTPEERALSRKSRLRWVLDPVDGTRTAIDYANGIKTATQFGVHLALLEDDVPVLGAAFFPAAEEERGALYYTGDDGKAYKQIGESAPKQIHASKPPFKPEGMRAAVHWYPKYRPETIAERPYVGIAGVGGQRVCLVAEGVADVAQMNTQVHPYKQWDLAAAHAILKAAGGELVSGETKEPLTYTHPDCELDSAFAGSYETLKLLGVAHEAIRPMSRERG